MTVDRGAVYQNHERSVDDRVADLLDRMTVEEKIGQLVGTFLGDYDDAEEMIDTMVEYSIGAVGPIEGGIDPYDQPDTIAELMNHVQDQVVERTRLGIPVLAYAGVEHGHGFVTGSTLFPQRFALAASRDIDLVEESAAVTATEVRRTGIHQALNPTCDVVRDPRWGRTFQTFGSSPHVCGEMSAAMVRGYQQDGIEDEEAVIATPKHYPAYGDPTRGEDAAPVDVSEYTLRRVFLPPFEAAIDAGADSVMPCYNEVSGHPVHGSRRHLTELLREELDFEGFVVSDWHGVDQLHEDHHTAATLKEATYQSVSAGLDVISVGGVNHIENLRELVEDGELSEERIDTTVRRVLRAKFCLGLFEDPTVDPRKAKESLGRDDHREVAAACAEQSLTLLENEGELLPLPTDLDDILVTGPNADNIRHQLGGWTHFGEPLPPGVTVLDGIEEAVDDATRVTYREGSTINEAGDLDAVRSAATDADVAVVVLGETDYIHEFARSPVGADEFPKRTQLELPDAQQSLLETVHETGIPTVLILVTGRPLAIGWAADHVPAILMAYYPGMEGGTAVGDVLFGETNPSGKLPISVPRSSGHLPTRFNYRPHPRPGEGIDSSHSPQYDPLYAFGHGLSYTTFEYESLTASEETIGPETSFEVSVSVANTGDRYGEETIDLFVTDEYSSRVTPVREHIGFEKIGLEPGENESVTFELQAGDLAIPRDDGTRLTEVGTFEFHVGELGTTVDVVSQYQ
jgi:beta-glucosidase